MFSLLLIMLLSNIDVAYCVRHVQGYRHFDFVPVSFVIPSEYSDFASELVMLQHSVSAAHH